MKFEEYTDSLDKLLNLPETEIYKICFEMLDLDNDKRISVSDVLTFMSSVKDTDVMNMNDLQKIIKHIDNLKNNTDKMGL